MLKTSPRIWFTILCVFLMTAGALMPGADDSRAKEYKARYRTYKGAKAIDGDTFFHRGKRYRIQQYNAPEQGQPGADRATELLRQKLRSGQYAWKPVGKDVYGRTIVKERKR